MHSSILLLPLLFLFLSTAPTSSSSSSPTQTQATDADVIVYGATPAGVLAAAAAAGEGARTLLVDPRSLIGGAMSGGLAETDIGTTTATIGGRTAQFFRLNGQYYGSHSSQYTFEPHVAEQIFRNVFLVNVTVLLNTRITSLSMGAKSRRHQNDSAISSSSSPSPSSPAPPPHPIITSATTDNINTTTLTAKVWIDTSYEGWMLPLAGVPHTWGREASSEYNESAAGVSLPYDKPGTYNVQDQWLAGVNPFWANGTLLPFLTPPPQGPPGSGDNRTQSYNYRVTLTNKTGNYLQPWPKPPGYDPTHFEFLRRVAQHWTSFSLGSLLPNEKHDCNAQTLDFMGLSWPYPAAISNNDWTAQQSVWDSHLYAIQGFFYTLANDPSFPLALHTYMTTFGVPLDEYLDTNHWPSQLYVREALRMKSDFVFTQIDREVEINKTDSIGMGAYSIDVLHVSRYAGVSNVTGEGSVAAAAAGIIMEGGVQAPSLNPPTLPPFQIPYRVMLPPKNVVTNLLVPVAVSASHMGFCSIRLEPTWMPMGESAGVAAAQAIAAGNVAVQDIDIAALQARLRELGQVLEL